MMNRVYFTADNIISSLGFNTEENFENINNGNIGIFPNEDSALSRTIVWASLIDNTKLNQNFERLLTQDSFTRLEKMFILSIKDVIDKSSIDPQSLRSLLIISTTKGNIDLLDNRNKNIFPEERIYLWSLAKAIGNYFGFINIPLVISSACISGSMAIIHAARMIARGEYDNIIVSGGDLATEFVISGFQSFQAISPEPCKPFDRDRKGLSIGEGCGTIFLTCDNTNTGEFGKIAYLGGSISNDANHISGPSRTGEGQFIAIRNSMAEARITPADIDYISAHGTATPFNDEMEAKAFARSGLLEAPVNSLKGYIGHTLGAAGVIEAAAMLASMRNNFVYQSAGFENHGVEEPINIAGHGINKDLNICLKTASGFGGCNAAFIVGKE